MKVDTAFGIGIVLGCIICTLFFQNCSSHPETIFHSSELTLDQPPAEALKARQNFQKNLEQVSHSNLSIKTEMSKSFEFECHILNAGVLCSGDNSFGELGDGTLVARDNPMPVFGMSEDSDVLLLAQGPSDSCAVTKARGVYCSGQHYRPIPTLIDGTKDMSGPSVDNLVVGENFTCMAIMGGARCWGMNQNGQLGADPASTRIRFTAEAVEGLGDNQGITGVILTPTSICAKKNNVVAKCWGGL